MTDFEDFTPSAMLPKIEPYKPFTVEEAFEVRRSAYADVWRYISGGIFLNIEEARDTALDQCKLLENSRVGLFPRKPVDSGVVAIFRISLHDIKQVCAWRLIAPFMWMYEENSELVKHAEGTMSGKTISQPASPPAS